MAETKKKKQREEEPYDRFTMGAGEMKNLKLPKRKVVKKDTKKRTK